MRYRILERHCLGKWGDGRCEDILHESEHFVAVIDGATTAPGSTGAKTPGRIMAELVDEGLGMVAADASMAEALRRINRHVRGALGYASSDAVLAMGPRPTAAAVIFSKVLGEVWTVGDGWFATDDVPYRIEIAFAEPYVKLRCAYVTAQRLAGVSVGDLLRSRTDSELIAPFVGLQPGIQNNRAAGRFAYGVFDGSDGCVEFAQRMDVSDARIVTLATDGYPTLGATLAETEALLADAIERDPLMIDIYPQDKPVRPGQLSFDDRTFVRLQRLGA